MLKLHRDRDMMYNMSSNTALSIATSGTSPREELPQSFLQWIHHPPCVAPFVCSVDLTFAGERCFFFRSAGEWIVDGVMVPGRILTKEL